MRDSNNFQDRLFNFLQQPRDCLLRDCLLRKRCKNRAIKDFKKVLELTQDPSLRKLAEQQLVLLRN